MYITYMYACTDAHGHDSTASYTHGHDSTESWSNHDCTVSETLSSLAYLACVEKLRGLRPQEKVGERPQEKLGERPQV